MMQEASKRCNKKKFILLSFVSKEIFASRKPPKTINRRFFPMSTDVRNHIYRATVQKRHSNIDQENLDLEKYGGDICLLDATYKTSCYALPTFFMCVKTNVDCCVVASFVIQQENADFIWEALHILQGWNPNWNPDFFMVDFCEAEINAIERTFPGKGAKHTYKIQ